MDAALFLDVDNTLTKGFIQQRFAELLGCKDAYGEIEKQFQSGDLSAYAFGEKLIALFNSNGFTEEFARDHFEEIQLQPWTDELLRLPIDRYLVSSGPNYYIEPLAECYGIELEKVICSRYGFDLGGCLASCDAIDGLQKSHFVGTKAKEYTLSIGVGDDGGKDGPFLSRCALSMLFTPQPPKELVEGNFLHITSFATVHSTLQKLGIDGSKVNRRPRVFIGSSSKAEPICKGIESNLSEVAEPTVWSREIFTASATAIEALESALADVDFAVLVVTPDDVLEKKGKTVPAARDNVLFELGLFMGRLGRERSYIVAPKGVPLDLPTDLKSVTKLFFDPGRIEEEQRSAVAEATNEIEQRIRKLGFRKAAL